MNFVAKMGLIANYERLILSNQTRLYGVFVAALNNLLQTAPPSLSIPPSGNTIEPEAPN